MGGHSNAVVCVTMDVNAQRAVSGSADNTICVWELNQGAIVRQLCAHIDTVTCVDADWLSQRVVSGSQDGTLKLWDLESGDEAPRQVLQGCLDEVRCVQARWPMAQNYAARARSKTLPR